MKITVVGVGNVGATVANVILLKGFASELVLLNTRGDIAEGKALDMNMTAEMMNFNTKIIGCRGDYSKTTGSDIVIITAGVPRKPGMTREELIGTNAEIVKSVIGKACEVSPNAVFIIITNPLDTMTYLAVKYLKQFGVPANRVIGMGGMLDTSRFIYYLSQAIGCRPREISGMVIGGHGDTIMIPMIRLASYMGISVTELLDKPKLDEIVHNTMHGGAILTKLIGTSAWYAPGAAGAAVAEAVAMDYRQLIPCSTYLDGEYGESDICMGVPAVIGKDGVRSIMKIHFNAQEKSLFKASVDAVRKTNNILENFI